MGNTRRCVIHRLQIIGYKKHTLAPKKGRSVTIDKNGLPYFGARPIKKEAERLIAFAKCVGIREAEYKNLRKNDYIIRNENFFVIVRKGKGGKYQEQLIAKKDVGFVSSFFDKNSNDRIFSNVEVKACEKANLHAYRRLHAQEMYNYYANLVGEERENLKFLVKEQFSRGAKHDIGKYGKDKHCIMKKFHRLESMLDVPYHTRKKDGVIYDRLSLIAISCLHLSHWRLDVTVQNYMQ